MFELKKYEEQMKKCSHCKFCNATCPVFLADLLETHGARARVELILAGLVTGELPVTRRFKEVVDRCLLCQNCVQTCPSGVPVDEIVAAARYQLYHGKRRNFVERKFLRSFMDRRGLHPLLVKLISLIQARGFLPPDVPVFAPEPFSARQRGVYSPAGEVRGRVVYFIGCGPNSMSPQTAADVIEVYNRNGLEVIVPADVSCCGLPALVEGDLGAAREMVAHNLELLSAAQADAVITDCTSCGLMLKVKSLKLIPETDPLRAPAAALSLKVFEATDYLMKVGLTAPPPMSSDKLTYHVPCHRSWTLTLNNAPRELVKKIPGAELVELEFPERCCGAGGAFHVHHSALSQNIRGDKLTDLRQTGAPIVLTQCPSCRSYLGAALPDHTLLHPLSFLAQVYERK